MGLFGKKDKTPKVIKKVQEMSDEEFLQYYKKYYARSAVDISVGMVLFIVAIVLIVICI